MKRHWLIIFSMLYAVLLFPQQTIAQEIPVPKAEKSKQVKISKAAEDLSVSLDENNESKIAVNYEKLANEFLNNGDNAKAEEYFKRALNSYTKLKRTEDKIRVTRSLAKVQESQKNFNSAIKNYEVAGALAKDVSEEKINLNDANRLKNQSNPASQTNYVDSNIELLKKEKKSQEVTEAYVQKAQNSLDLKDKSVAIESYKNALVYAKDKPESVIKIKNEIANVYASDNQFEKAIGINQKLLAEAVTKQDFNTQIKQLQSLATLYFKKEEPKKALVSLKEAYDLASKKGNSAEAKNTLSALAKYYKSNGNEKESMALYEQFFQNFDELIHSDTTLINAKTFQVTEGKIRQLEKEKSLKDELITKKNTFNYFLLGSILLLLLLFAFIVKALYAIKIKNKEIALQSLRREMNPHFIFNSLNSVNQFISENKELEANKYLTSYSNLMRDMMENSNKDFISLDKEVEQLKKYLDLEHLRFQDKFDFEITVDEKLDAESVFVPNMIIQPHLENAIWHGLRYLDKKGFLQLQFQFVDGKVVVIIDDNGIGLAKSKELKTSNQKVHESRGLNNTNERIGLLNELYKKNITFEIKEKALPESGTIVQIVFPLIDKI
ncbi:MULTISPECIES: histidine kinase [unclassified Flavobacterium]|uniref:tetratricopeptide repeat-containing sensor histidine kinase n=1 Tax=unclassified Flavobacterium TaxID=196869 RepID=UPI0012A8F167|nr:histidine kinase [Flavobacterium sp. SLB02]MBF4486814.1 histidine kinase [Flavobacterium sp. CSZ]QGK76402.1 regulator of cell autolysis [Flavobacterium sp. SLB02]